MEFSKLRETAALLVCLGVILLFPPVALIFGKPVRLFNIPLPVFYIFGTWLLLVVGAKFISRRLSDSEE